MNTNRANYTNLRDVGNPNGREFELGRMYKQGDPRARIIESIDYKKVEYRSLAAAVLAAIEENPTGYTGAELWDPPTGWMGDVHFAIVNRLGLKDWRNLTVVPSLKTSADVHHGIDFMVVYREPETDREVIVTIDLSLRNKENFKADILATESMVTPNTIFYHAPERIIPDPPQHPDPVVDKMIREALPGARRKALGETIADIIKEKLQGEDPHYGRAMRQISHQVQLSIEELLDV